MSKIQRSIQNVTGNITVVEGDVIVTDPSKGIVMEDDVGTQSRIKIVDDGGTKAIELESV